jgi:hypothetical protein
MQRMSRASVLPVSRSVIRFRRVARVLHDQVRDPIGRLGRGEMGDAVEHYEPPGLDAAGDVLKDRGVRTLL